VEVAEALSAALAEIDETEGGDAIDLLDDSGMTVERDEDGNLVVTLETDPNPNGNAEDDIDFGVVVAEAEPEGNGTSDTEGDNLLQIQGIDSAFRDRLQNAGLTTFAQIAALTPEELSERTGIPLDRIARYDLIEQARRLSDQQA
jgi:predicted flap endonuclease-1-like 5' DNA nuclease